MDERRGQAAAGEESAVSDDERVVVLELNQWLRNKLYYNRPLFQSLRRCPMCAQNPCTDAGKCGKAFQAWAKQQWSNELRREWKRRNEGVPPPNFEGN